MTSAPDPATPPAHVSRVDLQPEHHGFGIGQVSQSRLLRSPKVFWRHTLKIPTYESGDRTIGINEDQRPPAQGEEASYWPREANEVFHVSAVNQLHAWYKALYQAWKEHEWIGALGCRAPQTHTSISSVVQQQIPLVGFKGHFRL